MEPDKTSAGNGLNIRGQVTPRLNETFQLDDEQALFRIKRIPRGRRARLSNAASPRGSLMGLRSPPQDLARAGTGARNGIRRADTSYPLGE